MTRGLVETLDWLTRSPVRLGRKFGYVVLTAAVIGAVAVASASAAVDSGIAPSQSITLSSGSGQYFYIGSTAGGQPMESMSWLSGQDLGVMAAYSGNQAISIGRSTADVGSFSSASGNYAIAGAGISGYAVVQTFSAQASKVGPGKSGGAETAAKGITLGLPFTTTKATELVLIVVGGQGTGTLALSEVEATTLQNATYSEAGSDVIASAAVYSAQLPVGKHKAKWHSTTYLTNAGQSLGAVAYVLAPLPPPTITAVSPSSGPESGSTTVTITGTNFQGATAVRFGATNAQSFKVNSPTSIEAVSPAGSGTVDVTVSTPGGTSATSGTDHFGYVPPPAVSGVSPSSGPQAGGTSVTITGANFSGTTAVRFGGSSAVSFKVNSPTSIEAVSPSGTSTVDITVTNAYGTSATGSSDQFTYLAPSITASKGGPFDGGYALSIQVHNFPLGTFIYYCHDNSGPGGSDTIYFSHAVEVTTPNQSTWPGVFCYDSAPYVSYLVMDGVQSNSVQF